MNKVHVHTLAFSESLHIYIKVNLEKEDDVNLKNYSEHLNSSFSDV